MSNSLVNSEWWTSVLFLVLFCYMHHIEWRINLHYIINLSLFCYLGNNSHFVVAWRVCKLLLSCFCIAQRYFLFKMWPGSKQCKIILLTSSVSYNSTLEKSKNIQQELEKALLTEVSPPAPQTTCSWLSPHLHVLQIVGDVKLLKNLWHSCWGIIWLKSI